LIKLFQITAQLLNTKTGFRFAHHATMYVIQQKNLLVPILLNSFFCYREFEQQRETGARSSQQLLNQRSHDPAEVAAASSDIGTDKVGE